MKQIDDEMKAAIRQLRDADAQDPGTIAACNAVLGSTADAATHKRIVATARKLARMKFF
jgi:hypothetical protein